MVCTVSNYFILKIIKTKQHNMTQTQSSNNIESPSNSRRKSPFEGLSTLTFKTISKSGKFKSERYFKMVKTCPENIRLLTVRVVVLPQALLMETFAQLSHRHQCWLYVILTLWSIRYLYFFFLFYSLSQPFD